MIKKEKLNKIKKVLKRSLKNVSNDVTYASKEINKILKRTDRDDIRQTLYDGPSVQDMFEIERLVDSKEFKYDELKNDCRLYGFQTCDDNESYKRRITGLNKIVKKVGLEFTNFYTIDDPYMMDNFGKCKDRILFRISRGRNGDGDFVTVDMMEIKDIVTKIRECGAASAQVLDVFVDCADDVSDWIITFTFDD